jgi:NADPH:quinone reductase-like Zn-dependent oxidoreductase
MASETMHAVRIHRYGGPEVLRYEEAPRPEAGAGEVLVRVHGAGVNPVDWKTRAGRGMAKKYDQDPFPLILGWDVSGVVEAVGDGVGGLAPGDAVYGLVRFPRPGRCYAEYVAAPADELMPKPPSLDHVEAAGLPLVALTAWQGLFETGRLADGETVLIHAAAGGVGHVAVQLARWKGARVVGTASGRNEGFLRDLGVDQVVDYTTTGVEDVVGEVDVVLDPVGGEAEEQSFTVLRPGGRLVSLVADPPVEVARDRGVEAQRILVRPEASQLAQVSSLVEDKVLRPVIDTRLPLAEARAAHEQSERGHTRGTIVLVPE